MVVADAIFEECRGVNGLNATGKSLFNEHVERVVHRLPGNASEMIASYLSCLIGGDVWKVANCL